MKHWISNQPIAVKVALAPVVVLLCLLVLAAVGHQGSSSSARALDRVSQQALPDVIEVQRLKQHTAELATMVLRSLAYEGSGMKAKRIEKIDQDTVRRFGEVAEAVARLKQQAQPEDQARMAQIEQSLAKFRKMALDTLELKAGGLSAAAMLMNSTEKEYELLAGLVDEQMLAVQQRGQDAAGEAIATIQRSEFVSLVTVGLAVSLSMLAIWVCVRLITQPLREAVQIAQRVADGDLTAVVRTDRRDESGQVLRAMAQVSERLSGLMADVRSAATRINEASVEIASANNDLSRRTESTANSLQLTTGTVRSLTAQTEENSRSAEQACRLASQAVSVAQSGGEKVSELVQAMEQINSQALRIREIIGVIDGIAFQTNILALNAAVEAARAGEQGRGFAVVAQEVRALAGRSATSAKEIRALISSSVQSVDTGSHKAKDASDTMAGVVTSVHEILRLVSEMAQAGLTQASEVAEVNTALADMDDATQRNAAMAEQGVAATHSLQQQAEDLTRTLAVFRLREHQAA